MDRDILIVGCNQLTSQTIELLVSVVDVEDEDGGSVEMVILDDLKEIDSVYENLLFVELFFEIVTLEKLSY